jgi:iron complex outermembrane receptor protein
VLALSARAASAQVGTPDAQAQEVTGLDRIVVTATRQADDALVVPAAVDVVGIRDIRRAQPTVSLSESLQRIPGVIARDRQNEAQGLQVSIRGFGARSTFGIRGVRLYTDGIPATMPDGQGQVSHFMLGAAERIEVLRGPFSALHGNSSGGVISVFTAEAPPSPELSAGFAAGSDGLRRASLSFHAPWGGLRDGGALLDLVDVDNDGFRHHSASRQHGEQALFKGAFGNGGRYTVLFDSHALRADDPQGLTAAQLHGDRRAASQGALAFDTRKTVRQQQSGVHVEKTLSDHHAIELTLFDGRRDTTQMLSIPVFVQANPLQGGGAIALDRAYHGADIRWRWTASAWGRPFSLAGGVEDTVSDERRRGYENFVGDQLGVFGALRRDEGNRVTGRDVYLQADWQPADRWRINAGVRHSQVRFVSEDHYITGANPDDSGRLRYSRASPVAGVLFRVTPEISVYANAGGGFETPTFSELAYRGDGLSGLNDGLRAARSINREAGLRARHAAMQYSAAVFDSRTKDELVVMGNLGGRSVYANAGLTRRRGAELALSGALSPRWHYATAYTFLDARYASDFTVCREPPCAAADVLIARGSRIPGVSRHFAWGELRWTPRDTLDLVLEGRFADRVPVDDRNDEAAPAYASFDLAVERRFKAGGLDWRGYARIDNLLDRQYVGSVSVNDSNGRYYEPAPGRNWVLGLNATWVFH